MIGQLTRVGPQRSMVRASIALLSTGVIGTIGYKILGGDEYTWLDAVYMTAVTLTTVGYTEVIEVGHNPGAQVFTIALLLLGVGSFLYFFSNLTAFVVEGTLDRMFWRRRMRKITANISDHFIVCGGGKTGHYVMLELLQTNRPFVLIERDEERVESLVERFKQDFAVVIGDATDDTTLVEAGLERARGLVSCISSDKDNLVVAFSARNLRPELRIVSRCSEQRDALKLKKAGVDAIVTPDQIGGLRLVSELVRPTAVTFLDSMLREGGKLRIEEVTVAPGADLAQSTLGDVRQEEKLDLMVIAVRLSDGSWKYNPPDSTRLLPGTGLIFMGSPEARTMIEERAGVSHGEI
jgi:voltage-gated potassium channel